MAEPVDSFFVLHAPVLAMLIWFEMRCMFSCCCWSIYVCVSLTGNPQPPTKAEVLELLTAVGFAEAQWGLPVGSLSGGWKMKLALGETYIDLVS